MHLLLEADPSNSRHFVMHQSVSCFVLAEHEFSALLLPSDVNWNNKFNTYNNFDTNLIKSQRLTDLAADNVSKHEPNAIRDNPSTTLQCILAPGFNLSEIERNIQHLQLLSKACSCSQEMEAAHAK